MKFGSGSYFWFTRSEKSLLVYQRFPYLNRSALRAKSKASGDPDGSRRVVPFESTNSTSPCFLTNAETNSRVMSAIDQFCLTICS
jgi:hypothetical protein